jgi:hypothetical protein
VRVIIRVVTSIGLVRIRRARLILQQSFSAQFSGLPATQ